MRPLLAIKQYCLYCMNNQRKEVILCPFDTCFLYPYRFAKKQKSELTPLQAIKQKCLDCGGFSKKELRICQYFQCFLWVYRLGKNPKRKKVSSKPYLTMAQSSTIQNH